MKRGMENNLVENQEDADNVVIEGKGLENVVEDDDVDPLNASNISNDDPRMRRIFRTMIQ